MRNSVERYPLGYSPLAQKPTQAQLAELLRLSKKELIDQINYKETCTCRRELKTGSKTRQLIYPLGPLRITHERLKYHLKKVRHSDFLLSPRPGFSIVDNARRHLDQIQYLTVDIRKFYPSTTSTHVRDWCENELGMYPDVARRFRDLVTIDEQVFLGSPVTPVLTALIHRQMFESIANVCRSNGLQYTVWIDDLTISGPQIRGSVLTEIRDIIAAAGLKSHKIQWQSGKGAFIITGVGVVGEKTIAPNKLNLLLKELMQEYKTTTDRLSKEDLYYRILSLLGTLRFYHGKKSYAGQRHASRMNSLKQAHAKLLPAIFKTGVELAEDYQFEGLPWD